MDYLTTVYSRKEKPKTSYPAQLAKHIKKRFIKENQSEFLEIGCGNCDMLSEFSKLNLNTKGTDLLCSAGNDYPDLDIFVNNIEKEPLPFDDSTFDVIFSKSVIEHIYNPQLFFNEAFRVLKKGGCLISLTPDWEVQSKKFFDDWTHKTPFSKITMERLYTVSKFERIDISYFKQLPILWDNKLLYNISNLIAPFIREREKTKLRWLRERQVLGYGIKL